ncbi:small integral membrane protein 8 [Onthophagus taurus]|uniref:small integral membrane protein 8 n=1 Tax=Onthophagus taurus TaxID=166361 RepID=UPI000C20BA6A|nr:small integral membrane protein 8 [Onthophagus taurus]
MKYLLISNSLHIMSSLMPSHEYKKPGIKVRLTVLMPSQSELEVKSVMSKKPESKPGDGIRSLQTSKLFRTLNFELYMKPNAVIMGLGLACMGGALAYIAYMRYQWESMGYYSAVTADGQETFLKKKSKWE